MAPSLRFTAKFIYTTPPFLGVRIKSTREKNSAVSWNEHCRDEDVEGSRISRKNK